MKPIAAPIVGGMITSDYPRPDSRSRVLRRHQGAGTQEKSLEHSRPTYNLSSGDVTLEGQDLNLQVLRDDPDA